MIAHLLVRAQGRGEAVLAAAVLIAGAGGAALHVGPPGVAGISVDNNDVALCSLRGGLPVWTAAVRVGGAGAAGGGGGGARGGGALVRATAVRRVGTATPAQPRPRGGRHAVRAAPVLGDRAVATLHTAGS